MSAKAKKRPTIGYKNCEAFEFNGVDSGHILIACVPVGHGDGRPAYPKFGIIAAPALLREFAEYSIALLDKLEGCGRCGHHKGLHGANKPDPRCATYADEEAGVGCDCAEWVPGALP